METKLSKKPLAITLAVAFTGMLGASPLALADEGSSMLPAEPAPATEPAADAGAAPADTEDAATEETTAEETAPAPAPADSGESPGAGSGVPPGM